MWAVGPSSDVVTWQFGADYSNDTMGIVAILPGNTDTDFEPENFHFTADTAGAHEWLLDDLSALAPGAYYYVVRTQTRQTHGKLIKH